MVHFLIRFLFFVLLGRALVFVLRTLRRLTTTSRPKRQPPPKRRRSPERLFGEDIVDADFEDLGKEGR